MKKAIAILEFIVGMSAVVGGFNLISNDGLGLPKNWLSNSPFDSYFWPGVILAVVVGGTYILASLSMWKNNKYHLELSSIAGFGLLIWIFTELYILPMSHWLQILYFGIGTLTIVSVLIILKKEVKIEIKK